MEVEVLGVPVKSPSDKKEYRVIKLQNGLKALLIKSAKDDENAACQLKVNVGTFENPDHVEGLAHFLEHLLNMGSVKYPTESYYTDFMHANGGSDNANTTSEDTNYYFTIGEKAFVNGLDIFGNMFSNPLLSKNSMQREREAVDSEYRQALTNDFVILERIFQNFAHENHPYRKFDCGNLKTLKENISDDDLHRETLKLFEKYKASIMYLTIQSHRSLDEIQNLVVENFSAIKSGEVEKEPRPSYDKAFKDEFFSKIIYLKPKSDLKLIMISWVLPPYNNDYKTNLTLYFSELFRNESDGGLVKYLRDRGLINILQRPEPYVNDSFYMFKVALIAVNEFKNEDIEKILEGLYSYIMMLKETPIEVHRKKFEERMKRKMIEFQFQEESSALTNAKTFSETLRKCETDDILRRDTIVKFDESIFSDYMNHLSSDKFNMTIMDPKHENFNRREERYDRVYDSVEYPDSWKALWENKKSRPEFFIEKPNEFIAEKFEIYENESESPLYPEKVYDSGAYELWHKLDSTFKAPKANIRIRLLAPTSFRNTEAFVYEEIYDYMLTYYLKSLIEMGTRVHMTFGSSSSARVLEISFSGFNDKLPAYFELLMGKIKQFNENIEDTYFNSVVNEMKLKYTQSMSKVRQLNTDTLDEILYRHYEHDYEIFKWVEVAKFENLKAFVPKLFKKMKVQMLIQGNMRREEAMSLLDILRNSITVEPIEDDLMLRDQCREIQVGEKFLRVKSMQKHDDNSMIKSYYQIGKSTVRVKCLVSFLKLIMYPKAFDYLRNKEQLGYSVGMDTRQIEGIMGLIVYVGSQESKHPYPEVHEKITHFMKEVATKTVKELTDEEFNTLKNTLIQKTKEKDDTLTKEINRNWVEIKNMDYHFDIKEITVKVLETITKFELQEFFNSFTKPENARILNVHVIGDAKANFDDYKLEVIKEKVKEAEDVVNDIEDYKQSLSLHPVIQFEI